MKLKPLDEQVVVVTGASSGIGRETALRLARDGATVVGLARSETHLATLVDEIERHGGKARYVVCDVTDPVQVRAAADSAEEWFGRIDTWVNNAGVLLYGEFWRTSAEEFRRVMDVNFMGFVHGMHVALPALRRAGGGALIMVSSAEAVVTLPMHSAYAASKRAVDGAVDGLRRELISERAPISVTTIRPAAIDTPAYTTARNHMDVAPQAPPPFYDPAVVAECVAFAAEHPIRDLYAGGASRGLSMMHVVAPRVTDALFGRFGIRLMRTDARRKTADDNLYDTFDTGRVRGGLPRRGRRTSVYTWLQVRPRVRIGACAAASVIALTVLVRRRARRGGTPPPG